MSFSVQLKLINSDKSAHKMDVEVTVPEAESSSTMRGLTVTPEATAEVALKIPAENISAVDVVLKHTGIARLEEEVSREEEEVSIGEEEVSRKEEQHEL